MWGIDPSEEMLARARAHADGRLRSSGPRPRRFHSRTAGSRPRSSAWSSTCSTGRAPSPRHGAFSSRRASRARHFRPESLDRFWISKVFPAIVEIDRARFPTEAQLAGELADAGFETVRTRRLTQTGRLDRGEALERIRGRYISTLQLLGDEELAEGLARAERRRRGRRGRA